MEMLLKKVEDMSIEELQAEVKELRTKHVYFLEPVDFASVVDDEVMESVEVYTEEEMNLDELQEKTFHALRAEKFGIDDWTEWVEAHMENFNEETMRLLSTLKHRELSNE